MQLHLPSSDYSSSTPGIRATLFFFFGTRASNLTFLLHKLPWFRNSHMSSWDIRCSTSPAESLWRSKSISGSVQGNPYMIRDIPSDPNMMHREIPCPRCPQTSLGIHRRECPLSQDTCRIMVESLRFQSAYVGSCPRTLRTWEAIPHIVIPWDKVNIGHQYSGQLKICISD